MNTVVNEEVWSPTISASSFGRIQSTGGESEGTSPWKAGVGDFIKPVPIVRERAGAEIDFFGPRSVWSIVCPLGPWGLSIVLPRGCPPNSAY